METTNKYSKLRRQGGFIARICECSPAYVNMVLNGERTPKTARADKAQLILEKADQLLAILERPAPYNKI